MMRLSRMMTATRARPNSTARIVGTTLFQEEGTTTLILSGTASPLPSGLRESRAGIFPWVASVAGACPAGAGIFPWGASAAGACSSGAGIFPWVASAAGACSSGAESCAAGEGLRNGCAVFRSSGAGPCPGRSCPPPRESFPLLREPLAIPMMIAASPPTRRATPRIIERLALSCIAAARAGLMLLAASILSWPARALKNNGADITRRPAPSPFRNPPLFFPLSAIGVFGFSSAKIIEIIAKLQV